MKTKREEMIQLSGAIVAGMLASPQCMTEALEVAGREGAKGIDQFIVNNAVHYASKVLDRIEVVAPRESP